MQPLLLTRVLVRPGCRITLQLVVSYRAWCGLSDVEEKKVFVEVGAKVRIPKRVNDHFHWLTI